MTITADHVAAKPVTVAAAPAWATDRDHNDETIMFSRTSTVEVLDAGGVKNRPAPPILQQLVTVSVQDGQIIATLDEYPVISLDIEAVTLGGAKDLIRALTELIDAYEAQR